MGEDENIDLAEEHRRFVLDAFPRLGTMSFYDLLGVARDADKKTIKRAYFRLATIVHPDRHYGKNLGSFKPKMDALFARLSEAYDTLSVAERRAAYDRTLPANRSTPVGVSPRSSTVEGRTKVKLHLDAAARARAAGDFVAAAEAYKLALALSPNDTAIKTAYAEVMSAAMSKLSDGYRRQALLEERDGHWREAATSWKHVVDARPDDVEAKQRLAAALAKG